MAEERVVVYTAHQGRDVDILIMQLSRAGIEAAKDPDREPDHAPRWQVSVSGRDEYHAREIVGRFEQDRRDVAPPGAGLGQDVGADAGENDDSLHNPTTVYSASSVQEAHFLKNLLVESGINAMVSNELLHRGSGVDLVGLPTAAKVVVAARDAETARRLALEFDRRTSVLVEPEATAGLEPGESVIEVPAPWPHCPQCDTRRTTRCPICPTSGTDFEEVDPEFAGALGLPGDASDTTGCGSSCSCGQEPQAAAPQSVEAEAAEPPGAETSLPRLALMCPTCDEPFVPEFPRRCEWCGHEFADGYDVEDHLEREPIPVQAMIVILGLVTLVLVACAYFAWIV